MKGRARQIVSANIADARAVLEQLADLEPTMEAAAEMIAAALLSGHKLLACGNGGSAADASHLTTEFVARFDRERRAYPAISLATHGGDLTAIGNDYSIMDSQVDWLRTFLGRRAVQRSRVASMDSRLLRCNRETIEEVLASSSKTSGRADRKE